MFHHKQLFEKGLLALTNGNFLALSLLLTLALTPLFSFSPHPYHVSYTEVAYSKKEHSLTFSLEVFTDDLENAIKIMYQPTRFFLGSDSLSESTEILIQQYVLEKTTLVLDGVVFNGAEFLPTESNPDRTIIYFQYTDLPPISSLAYYSEILTSIFKDQQNIVELRNEGIKEKALLSSDKKSVTWKLNH